VDGGWREKKMLYSWAVGGLKYKLDAADDGRQNGIVSTSGGVVVANAVVECRG
jgi:hypothetical protein